METINQRGTVACKFFLHKTKLENVMSQFCKTLETKDTTM